jgi:hypothetical protein
MKRIQFGKKFAGVRVKGKVKMSSNALDSHIEKAAWLTAGVESGFKYGTVISYDGTGITAGSHQAILVYPRYLDDQGPLCKLTARVLSAVPKEVEIEFRQFLGEYGTVLTPHGVAIDLDGKKLNGRQLRGRFTGDPDGVMPVSGKKRERAERAAKEFSELFAHPATFDVQDDYGKEHFVKRAERVKMRFSKFPAIKRKTIQDATYGADNPIYSDISEAIGPELDLAMCVYWSNCVNAPGMALKKLCKVVRPRMSKPDLARAIIQAIGNTSFGRWDDDIKGGRYQRTRTLAKKLWSKDLFSPSGVMPKDLPD